MLWRRIVARGIRSDPEWLGGEYTKPPRGWLESFALFRMMLDGVPHLQATIPDRVAADAFVQSAVDQATESSYGHFTQAHPSLWAAHVATFLGELDQP